MSATRTSFLPVDLSRLPAPVLVPRLSYEECRAGILADFQARWPDFDALVESDPAIKLLEAAAQREMLLRAALNDVGRSTMLAFAGGADLDHIAAGEAIARLVVTPATETAPAVMEDDEALRARVQLARELLAGPGLTGGGYRGAVLTMAPELKDVRVLKREGGRIDLILLGQGDGSIDAGVVARVREAFTGDNATHLTDIVSVRPATSHPWSAVVLVEIRPGPDPELVRSEAEAAVRAYAAQRHRVGQAVYAQMIASSASVGGVERVSVSIDDVVPAPDAAPLLAALTVQVIAA